MRLSDEKKSLVTALRTQYGDTVTRKQVLAYTDANSLEKPRWLFNNKNFRAGRGAYDLTKVVGATPSTATQAAA